MTALCIAIIYNVINLQLLLRYSQSIHHRQALLRVKPFIDLRAIVSQLALRNLETVAEPILCHRLSIRLRRVIQVVPRPAPFPRLSTVGALRPQIVWDIEPQVFQSFSHDGLDLIQMLSSCDLSCTGYDLFALRINDSEVPPS